MTDFIITDAEKAIIEGIREGRLKALPRETTFDMRWGGSLVKNRHKVSFSTRATPDEIWTRMWDEAPT